MNEQSGNTTSIKIDGLLRRLRYLNGTYLFVFLNVVFIVVFFGLLQDLLVTSWYSEYYSYIPFIPLISAYLIYTDRQTIFSQKEIFSRIGLLILGAGIIIHVAAGAAGFDLDHNDYLSLMAATLIILWIGVFTLSFGVHALRSAVFPLVFLLFAVPIPNALRDSLISFLQWGSTAAAYGFLKLAGIPVVREGYIFHLQTMNIEVAPVCSGIRSGLSLLVTGFLASHFFLKKNWTKALLMLSLVPITIVKNGFRIATLATLGVYWDQKILDSDLHHKGGILFFILALAAAGGVVMILRKLERRSAQGA